MKYQKTGDKPELNNNTLCNSPKYKNVQDAFRAGNISSQSPTKVIVCP